MPLLLPAMTRQLLALAGADLLRLLSEGSIALPDSHRLPLQHANVRMRSHVGHASLAAPCAWPMTRCDGYPPGVPQRCSIQRHVAASEAATVAARLQGDRGAAQEPAASVAAVTPAAPEAAGKGEAEEPPAKKAKTVC